MFWDMRAKICFVISIVILISVCAGCGGSKNTYFLSQPYLYVKDVKVERLEVNRSIKEGENYNALTSYVCDSLCFLFTHKDRYYNYSVLNLNNGKHEGYFLRRGNGPLESYNVAPIFEIYKEGGDMKSQIYDLNKHRFFYCNITESVKQGVSVYDTIKHVQLEDKNIQSIAYNTLLDDNRTVVAFNSKEMRDLGKVITPKFAVLSKDEMRIEREYKVFCDSVVDFRTVGKWEMYAPFNIKISTNKKVGKVAFAMANMPQLNILDLNTGELKCKRIEGLPEETINKNILFYMMTRCDENYVYALYRNHNREDDIKSQRKRPCEVHIFDWDGNLVRRCELNRNYNDISVTNGKLYGFYYYDGTIDEYLL